MSTITPSTEAIEASEARADAAGDTGLIEVTEHGDLVEPGRSHPVRDSPVDHLPGTVSARGVESHR